MNDTTRTASARERWVRPLDLTLYVLLAALLLLVLSEAWLNGVLLDTPSATYGTVPPTTWPRVLKNVLYVALLVATALKYTLSRRWRTLLTGADAALVALVIVLVLSGLASDSPLSLIGKAMFVYLRGAIVFYAWRALRPSPAAIRRFLYVLAPVVVLHVVAAIAQFAFGWPAYAMFGWTDTTWFTINRAQGVFRHPNDVGHLLALALLGLAAYLAGRPRRRYLVWGAVALAALALAASQSRESMLAVMAGLVVVALVNRVRITPVAGVAFVVILAAALPLLVTPSNRAEWNRRFAGVVNAVEKPSGYSEGQAPTPAPACDKAEGCQAEPVPPPAEREIRILYARQAAKLWLHRPLLGYGTGQFGGYVAYQNNPHWNEDPRFGPHGFNLHGFYTETVDSFWIHLGVETGALGALAYLAWLFLLCRPLLRRARRRPDPSEGRQARRRAPPPMYAWAIAAVAASVLIAFLAIALEDPLYPALLFTVLGIAWALGVPEVGRGRIRRPGEPLRVGMVIISEYEANARVRREAEALAARGDDVTVLALDRPGAPRVEMIDGVRVVHLRIRKYRGDSSMAYVRLYGTFFIAATWWMIRRPRAFDLVHVHTMPEAVVFAAVAQKAAGVPILLDVHDLTYQLFASKFRDRGLIMRGIKLSTRAALAFADEVLTVHEPYAETVRGLTSRRITVVLNSADERLFPPRPHRPPQPGEDVLFSYHGLIAPRHGLDSLVEALAALRRDVPGARLQILGSGDGLTELRARVDALGLTDAVSLPDGVVPITAIPPALERVSFGVVPSRLDPWTNEVLPTKLLEYASLGIPVITFRNHVIARYFPDDAVTYVDPATPDTLLAAMRTLTADPTLAHHRANRASAVMTELCWSSQRPVYLALIDRMSVHPTPIPAPRPASTPTTLVPAQRTRPTPDHTPATEPSDPHTSAPAL
jgi:glycosyltransferase involved in cell wall biosynthesis